MRSLTYFTAVLATSIWINSITSLCAQTSKNVVPLSTTQADKWHIRWDRSDDFNSDHIDWRKWNKSPENFGAWVWDNENNVAVSDGVLKITMRRLGTPVVLGNRPPTPFTSGMMKSHVAGTYGYYEARLKGAPLFPGVCPSFWLYSKIDDSIVTKGDTRYSEVDIVELTQRGDRVSENERIADCNMHAILSNGTPGKTGREWYRPNDIRFKAEQANEVRLPFDPQDDFHTYGCEITADTVTWFIDGKQIGQKPNRYWHRKMNVALSLGLRPPYSIYTVKGFVPSDVESAEEFPTTMLVDYVRVWDRVK